MKQIVKLVVILLLAVWLANGALFFGSSESPASPVKTPNRPISNGPVTDKPVQSDATPAPQDAIAPPTPVPVATPTPKHTATKPAATPVVSTTPDPSVTTKSQPPDFSSDILKTKDFPEILYQITATPNDPLMPQWFSTYVEANDTWDIAGNSNNVVVAVIDTGFALGHEEFANRWAINNGEQGVTSAGSTCWTGVETNKQTNNCDDDSNGYIDDWRGWNFSSNTNDPQAGQVNATGGGVTHGTNTAGFIAATGNNGVGLAGMNWNAKIMPLMAMSDNGSGYTSDIVAAMEYAVDNGADVINLSLGGPSYDEAMDTAVTYAEQHGVVVVAAAGNCADSSTGSCSGTVGPGRMLYPALYTNVVAVGATTTTEQRASFSSYGSQLDLVAPGSNLPTSTTWSAANPTNAYSGYISGTSFASPIVAGIVSLMKANAPNLRPVQIRTILTESTDKVGAMSGQNFTTEYGFGRVNAYKAVAHAKAAATLLAGIATVPEQRFASPSVHAAFGQPGTRTVKTTDTLPVYCFTRPGSTCTISLIKKSNNVETKVDTAKSDISGVAYSLFDPLPAGEYWVRAHDNELASPLETIVVQ